QIGAPQVDAVKLEPAQIGTAQVNAGAGCAGADFTAIDDQRSFARGWLIDDDRPCAAGLSGIGHMHPRGKGQCGKDWQASEHLGSLGSGGEGPGGTRPARPSVSARRYLVAVIRSSGISNTQNEPPWLT